MQRLALVTVFVASLSVARADEFALRDGDTVVFLGDSITAARTYSKIIEDYTLLRFPDRKVRFINAGQGGDTAAGGLKRLDRDVFSRGATVLVVAFGTNDIGWGALADEAHENAYLEAVQGIIDRCREKKVRLYLCSAAITSMEPDKAEKSFLQLMCDKGLAKAKAAGMGVIDVQRTMREVQRRVIAWNKPIKDAKNKEALHLVDGVHLNDLGQLAMAFAILKGFGAPADVSSAEVDAAELKAGKTIGCKITNIEKLDNGLAFTRLDDGLPLNQGLFWALNFRFVPIATELNRYMLSVTGLSDGSYEVHADGRKLGKWTNKQLAGGINICSSTADAWQPGGPWNVQAGVVHELTEARHKLATSLVLSRAYQKDDESKALLTRTEEINERIEALQREAARPRPYRFEVRLVK